MLVMSQPVTPVTVRSSAVRPVGVPVNPIENVCAKRPTIGSACGSMLITDASGTTSYESARMPSPVALMSPCVWVTFEVPVPAYEEPPPPPPEALPDPPPP